MSADASASVTVTVTSPSRLHFTLIDLNGELGRVDAGIGMLMLMSSQVALSVLMQVLTSLETLLVLALGLVLEQEQELVMSVFEPA